MDQKIKNTEETKKQNNDLFIIKLAMPNTAKEDAVKESFPRQTFTGQLLEMMKFTIIAAVVVTPIRFFVAQPFIVEGESMDPTFSAGQYLIVDEITYRSHLPERGDVVVFRYPRDPSKYFIKRIIGLPEETVNISNGNVTVISSLKKESIALNEPYIKNTSFENSTEKLGKDEYFVMGDNRSNSLDSRSWGPVPKANITGSVLARIFPFSLAGVFPGKELE